MANRKKVVVASHHQGDSRYGFYAGTQCVANVASFLLYSEQMGVQTMRSKDIDNVLNTGNNIYRSARARSSANFLLPTDLPRVFGEGFWRCEVIPLAAYYGEICSDIADLCASLTRSFENSSTLFFTVKDVCIGLKKVGERYYVFDSHSRDRNGYTDAFGKACIIHFPRFGALCNYLLQQYGDIHSVRFQIVGCKVANLADDYSRRGKTFVDESSYFIDAPIGEYVVTGADMVRPRTRSQTVRFGNCSTDCKVDKKSDYEWQTVSYLKRNSSS